MPWLNGSLAVFDATLLLVALTAWRAGLWQRVRWLALLGFQMAGVILVSWLLVTAGAPATAAGGIDAARAVGLDATLRAVATLFVHSLVLIVTATLVGGSLATAAAHLVTAVRRRQVPALTLLAAAVWILPTFLIAVLIQELQAQIFTYTGQPVGTGYGTADGQQIFWCSLVLGLRPAAYVYRQSRVALEAEMQSDHVRTAMAKGLAWNVVARRHILRPAVSTLLASQLSSIRLMVGSLPLVEFFLGYPGLGRSLILAVGITYLDQPAVFSPDLAIALVTAMAALLVVLEALGRTLQQIFDPRLRELDLAPQS